MSDIVVRRAVEADAERVAEFAIAMARETEHKELDPPTVLAGVNSALARPELAFYLVAEVDALVAGVLMVTTEWSDWRNGQYWWVQSVYVDPAFRRRGIYKLLYRAVKDQARAHADVVGCRLYVERDNKVAQGTYRKLGMEETAYIVYEEMF